MRFSIPFVLLNTIFFACTVPFISSNQRNYYGPLVMEIRDKYRSSGVIVLSLTNPLPFDKKVIQHEVISLLHNEVVRMLAASFKNLGERLQDYMEKADGKPLIVTFIDSISELENFKALTKDVDMGYATWFIFFPKTANHDICQFCANPQGNPLNLKFNSNVLVSCCNAATIKIWWCNKKNHVVRQIIGLLRGDNAQISWFSNAALQRREYSLDGQPLRVVITKDADEVLSGNSMPEEMLTELSLAMNFTISQTLEEFQGGYWISSTSRWNDVIERLNRHEADLGVGSFLMTNERKNVIKYTEPVVTAPYKLYIRTVDSAPIRWNAHYQVFSDEMWISIIMVIVTAPLLLMLITYTKIKSNFLPRLLDHYLSVWGIFCSQSFPDSSGVISTRIMHVSLYLSTAIIVSVYCGFLMSSLTVSTVYVPFTTLEDFVNDGSYKLTVLKNTTYVDIFKNTNTTLMQRMGALMIPEHSLPLTSLEAYKQVCDDGMAFYINEGLKERGVNSMSCDTIVVKTQNIDSLTWMVPRASEYLDVINHHIRQFKKSGVVKRLERKYWTKPEDWKVYQPSPVSFQQVIPLFVILTVGFVVAVVILIIEMKYSTLIKLRCHKRLTIKRKRKILPPPIYPYCP